MDELITFLQTFANPPFLALPTRLESVFLRYVEKRGILLPCQLIAIDDYKDYVESEAALYLKNHENINFYLASRIKNVLPDISIEKKYRSNRLIWLQKIKKELVQANLLDINHPLNLQGKDIVIAFHPLYDKTLEYGKVHHFFPKPVKNQSFTLYLASDESKQIHCAIESIYELLKKGIDINAIKIVNATREDTWLLHKEAALYGFSIDENRNYPLDSHPFVIQFMNEIKSDSIESALLRWSTLLESDPTLDTAPYEKIISIIDQYGISKVETEKELLFYEIEKATLSTQKQKDVVSLESSLDSFINPDEYYIVLNYTDTLFPALKKDDDYLSDDEKTMLGLRTSIEENEMIKQALKVKIRAVKHVTFIMPLKNMGKDIRRSELFKEFELDIIPYESSSKSVSGSKAYERLDYHKKAFALRQYGKYSCDYDLLHSTFADIDTQYNPKFKGLDAFTIQKLLKRGFSFSPTNLERFNACKFRFLLDYLLKIIIEEPRESILFGNLAHHILANAFQSNQKIHDLGNDYLNSLQHPISDKMLVQTALFMNRLEKVIDYLEAQDKDSTFQDVGYEMGFDYEIANHPHYSMKGKIDRVKTLNHDGQDYYAVIDYKTGTKKFNLTDFENGIDIQPLFYLNLLQKKNYSTEFKPFGFFYQGVNLKRLNKEKTGNTLEKALRMSGASIDNVGLLTAFSPNLNIVGMSLNQDGSLGKTDKVVHQDTLQSMIDAIDTFIEKAIIDINQGEFSITPLPGKDDFDDSPACTYCPHGGICYLRNRFVSVIEDTTEGSE